MTHEFKILPNYFNDIMFRNKRFEIRKNDRNFHEGDKLILKEWSALSNDYTGNEITALVDYIHYGNGDFGLAEGYCVIGLTDIFCVFGK